MISHPGQDVPGLAGRDHHRVRHPRVPARHRQHRQHQLPARLTAGPNRDRDRREPQIALSELAGGVLHPIGRVGREEQRSQLTHPVLEDGQRTRPADPLGDHRRRHSRELGQQRPDLRLDRIHERPARPTLARGRRVRPQRRPHRVPCQSQPASDLLDRHALGAVQSTNLSPLFQPDHPSSLKAGVSPNPSLEGQSQRAVDSVRSVSHWRRRPGCWGTAVCESSRSDPPTLRPVPVVEGADGHSPTWSPTTSRYPDAAWGPHRACLVAAGSPSIPLLNWEPCPQAGV